MTNNSRSDCNKAILKKIVDIFNTGDLSDVDSFFASDYVDHQKPPRMESDGPNEFKQIVMNARGTLRELIEILRFANGQVVEHWGAEEWRNEKSP